MALLRRIRAAAFDFVVRVAPSRKITADDLVRSDSSTHPGGKGLRFTERLRERLRSRWLRLRRYRK